VGLVLHLVSFGAAYAAASDLSNLASVYWLHHFDSKWTPEGNVAIFRQVLPLLAAIASLSCAFGVRSAASWLDTHVQLAIASGVISGLLAAASLFALGLILPRGWQILGTPIFLFGPGLSSYAIIGATRRLHLFSA
jgi:hypothetical protein